MHLNKSFDQKLFPTTQQEFNNWAIELFYYQAKNNIVYSNYIDHLSINVEHINSIFDIPFLPIQFFKTHVIKTDVWNEQKVFESSGTTDQVNSRKYVKSLDFYQNHALKLFNDLFGHPENYHIMALLPSYLERDNSSLIYMVKTLISESKSELSGFYLNNYAKLKEDLSNALNTNRKVILIGVSFALLDFIEHHEVDLANHIVMETGGMKGRRKEMIREELHSILCKGFNVSKIHSEYGMTELFSQAYSTGGGLYKTPPSMKIILRDLYDPFQMSNNLRQGGINIIDLANYTTCSFIETQDIGRAHGELFEVVGRFDSSDVRGCNLMI